VYDVLAEERAQRNIVDSENLKLNDFKTKLENEMELKMAELHQG
jgi:hypothetical protein